MLNQPEVGKSCQKQPAPRGQPGQKQPPQASLKHPTAPPSAGPARSMAWFGTGQHCPHLAPSPPLLNTQPKSRPTPRSTGLRGLVLSRSTKLLSSSEPCEQPPRSPSVQHDSQQPLQCPLLVHLVGAVTDVGVEVLRGVLFHDVADVGHDEVLLVSLLQVFKEARGRKPAASPRASPGQGRGDF